MCEGVHEKGMPQLNLEDHPYTHQDLVMAMVWQEQVGNLFPWHACKIIILKVPYGLGCSLKYIIVEKSKLSRLGSSKKLLIEILRWPRCFLWLKIC